MRPGYAQSSYTQDAFGTGSAYGHPPSGVDYGHQQGYAPSSYTHHQQQPPGGFGYAPPAPMSTISSASWSNSNTFPAPRRASNQALVPPLNQSTIAPKGGSHRHDPAIDPRHHVDDTPHKHHSKSRGHVPSVNDDWDTKSDASYYARPKVGRARSGSSMSDITTTARGEQGHRHSHSHSHSHHVTAHNTPRGSPLHGQSPSSPSPLARGLAHGSMPRSPLSPRTHIDQKHSRKICGLGEADSGPASIHAHNSPYQPVTPLLDVPDLRGRDRHPRSERRHRHHSASFEDKERLRPMPGYASDDEDRYSASARSRGRDKHAHDGGDYGTPGRHQSSSRPPHKHRAEAYPDEQYDRESSRGDHHSQSGHSHHHASGKHHRPRSHSHVPPPLPYRGPSPAPPAGLHPPHRDHHLMPDMGALSLSGRDHGQGQERSRAHSMQYHNQSAGAGAGTGGQGQYIPSPASLAGFGPGGTGAGGYAGVAGQYQTPPSMLGEGFDDGGSVAGSAMTFMDGALGGRTSQYGLPKYPHQAKPDPRR
jgi:hypothetical protein